MAIHACIDRVVPPRFRAHAARAAASEHPGNVTAAGPALEMAVEHKKLWKPGRTLRIRFLGGTPRIQRRVQEHAQVWLRHANLQMEFVSTGDAEIRIAFEDDGSWSAVGTDALVTEFFPTDGPTMNYGWLTDDAPDDVYSSVVLHEFGHALGCVHEHESPKAEIRWNKPVVYRDLAGPPNFWDKETVDANVFGRYSKRETKFTEFDPESIMLYSFPASWTLDGQSFEESSELSELDKKFIRECYPGAIAV